MGLCSGRLSLPIFGPDAKTHMQESIKRVGDISSKSGLSSSGFEGKQMSLQIPILHAGWMHAASKLRGWKDKAVLQTLLLSGWVSPTRTLQQTDLTGLLPRGCDQLKAFPHRVEVYEHVKYLITISKFVCCLLSLTANEESMSIPCLFVRYLQNLLNHKTHRGNTGQNEYHEEVANPMLAMGRIHSQMTRTRYAAGKAGDGRKCI